MSTIESLERLREWANVSWEPWAESRERLHKMLDEIEAETAEMKAFCERVEKAAKAREELEVFGTAYMPLPLDADGVPIHMGDAVEGELLRDNATVRGTVCTYHIHDDDEPGTVYIRVKPTKDTWTIKELRFERCRHVKPRTLEDVLSDFAVTLTKTSDKTNGVAKAVDECADEIRELLGVDDD